MGGQLLHPQAMFHGGMKKIIQVHIHVFILSDPLTCLL